MGENTITQAPTLTWHTHTDIITHTEILTLSFKWTSNGARKWRELSAVETKTRLDTSAVEHVGFDILVQKGLGSRGEWAWGEKENGFMRIPANCNLGFHFTISKLMFPIFLANSPLRSNDVIYAEGERIVKTSCALFLCSSGWHSAVSLKTVTLAMFPSTYCYAYFEYRNFAKNFYSCLRWFWS